MSDTGQAPYADDAFEDREAEFLAANDLATNDAVAGETVTRGGSPAEATPYSDEHDESIEVADRDPADFDDATDD